MNIIWPKCSKAYLHFIWTIRKQLTKARWGAERQSVIRMAPCERHGVSNHQLPLFPQSNTKENSKSPFLWPLVSSPHKEPVMRKYADAMTSSCNTVFLISGSNHVTSISCWYSRTVKWHDIVSLIGGVALSSIWRKLCIDSKRIDTYRVTYAVN